MWLGGCWEGLPDGVRCGAPVVGRSREPGWAGVPGPMPVAERVQRGHPGFLAGRSGAETHPTLPRSVAGPLEGAAEASAPPPLSAAP